jgi:outer membrane protein assembly factor BamB
MHRSATPRKPFPLPLALCVLLATGATAAAEWPQWGGSRRDFSAENAELAHTWPASGPETLWRRPLGEGYSSAAIAGERLFTLYRDGGDEVVVALDPETGRTLWQHRWPEPTQGFNLQHGPGPHSTPLVAGERVFAVGARGRLVALEAATGTLLWSRELIEGLGGTFFDRGYAPSPIAWGDTVIATVGGEGHAVVAFRQRDGSLAWQAQGFGNSPSSPLLVDVGGSTQLVAFLARELVGLSPDDGALLWRHEHLTEWDLNISAPVFGGDGVLFYSSAYDGGGGALRLTRNGAESAAEPLWFSNQVRLHFTNAIRIGDALYFSNGDFGPVPLSAVDVASGEILWRDRHFARASLVRAGDVVVLLDEDGTLGLVRLSREGMELLAEHQLLDRRAWTPPTLSGRTLFVRDREEIRALRLPGRE